MICMFISFNAAPRPECTVDPECPTSLACIREKCQDPCQRTTCGIHAQCKAANHRAICSCIPGYEGDPYRICNERKHALQYYLGCLKKNLSCKNVEFIFSWMQK